MRGRSLPLLLLVALLVVALFACPAASSGSCGDGSVSGPLTNAQVAQWRWLAELYEANGGEAMGFDVSCWDVKRGATAVCDTENGTSTSWAGVECLFSSAGDLSEVRRLDLGLFTNVTIRTLPSSWEGCPTGTIQMSVCGVSSIPDSWAGVTTELDLSPTTSRRCPARGRARAA